MKQTEIKRLSHELRLYGIHENFERRLTLASSEGQTGEELLIRLLEDEKQYRKNRFSKILDNKAKFRRNSLIEDWDFSFERGISKTKLRELATLNFWDSKKNLISRCSEIDLFKKNAHCIAQIPHFHIYAA